MSSILSSAILLAVAAIVTFILRAAPFIIFGSRRQMPDGVKRVADILPAAIMSVLVIYCVKEQIVALEQLMVSGVSEEIANIVGAVVALFCVVVVHIWKRKTLLSIATGTLVYMVLIRVLPLL